MAKHVCVLGGQEADDLKRGIKPDCRRHRHVQRNEARMMVLGRGRLPWLEGENFRGIAKWAELPRWRTSNKHIVMLEAQEWRKVTQRTPFGGLGYATMQLVQQARSR